MTILRFLRRYAAVLIAASAFAPATASADMNRRSPQLAQAGEVVLPDGRFPSMTDYIAGTWVWEREAPRQTRHMRFSRNGDFFYRNLTLGLSYHGRYELKPGALRVIIHRTCDNDGQTCGERNPPLDRNMSLRPVSADAFDSQEERWKRLRRE